MGKLQGIYITMVQVTVNSERSKLSVPLTVTIRLTRVRSL